MIIYLINFTHESINIESTTGLSIELYGKVCVLRSSTRIFPDQVILMREEVSIVK